MLLLILIGYPIAFALTATAWLALSKFAGVRQFRAKSACVISLFVLFVLAPIVFVILTRENTNIRPYPTIVNLIPNRAAGSVEACLPDQMCPDTITQSSTPPPCPPGHPCPDSAKIGHALGLPHWVQDRQSRWAPDEQAALINNDNILKDLPNGSAIVTTPEKAIEYKPFDVSLRVAHKSFQDPLEHTKASAKPGTESSGRANVKMSRTPPTPKAPSSVPSAIAAPAGSTIPSPPTGSIS
jgi:hypothetical protein